MRDFSQGLASLDNWEYFFKFVTKNKTLNIIKRNHKNLCEVGGRLALFGNELILEGDRAWHFSCMLLLGKERWL